MSDKAVYTPTRSARRKTKPQRYGDFLEVSPTKRRILVSESSDSEDKINEEFEALKPTALFGMDDVEGQDMFGFKSRHTKLDLLNKVKDVISMSPRVVLTPLRTPTKNFHRGSLASPAFNRANEATPRHVREIVKKKIIQEIDSGNEGSDYSGGSSSDFVPDGSDNESEASASSPSESEEEEEEEKPVKKPAAKIEISKSKGRTRQKDSEYIVTPDNYFMMHSSKKITTSDHTLARLKNLSLNDNINEEFHISEEHKNKIDELYQSYEYLFNKWLYTLNENFNLILYGIGSKRSLLQKFQAEKLQDFPCMVVNGFFPSLTLKSILESILVDLLKNSNVPANVGELCDLIDSQLSENGEDLFLIIHNIDGAMLRNSKTQATLACISQLQNVHVIATIDHISAPLVWDYSKLNKYNFRWWDVTTFKPYSVETSFETNLMCERSGALQLSSLSSVFRSLTKNAKGIFNIIIQYQLENYKQAHYQGIPFKDLYSKSRAEFLVSSDLALRAQLTEFLDHKLVKMKRTYEGSENLIIPIDNTLLQQFMEEQDS